MDEQTIYWLQATLSNDDNASDNKLRALFIEGGLTKEEANEWIAKRTFYLNNIVSDDDNGKDVIIYGRKTRSVKSPTA